MVAVSQSRDCQLSHEEYICCSSRCLRRWNFQHVIIQHFERSSDPNQPQNFGQSDFISTVTIPVWQAIDRQARLVTGEFRCLRLLLIGSSTSWGLESPQHISDMIPQSKSSLKTECFARVLLEQCMVVARIHNKDHLFWWIDYVMIICLAIIQEIGRNSVWEPHCWKNAC